MAARQGMLLRRFGILGLLFYVLDVFLMRQGGGGRLALMGWVVSYGNCHGGTYYIDLFYVHKYRLMV